MRDFILRRLLYAIPTLIGISIITFAIARLAPGDPIRLFTFGIRDFTEADYLQLLHRYGLDKPMPLQYIDWITNAVRGNFGESLIYHRESFTMLMERLPNTLVLAAAALLLQLVIGVPLGVVAAFKRGTWVDGAIRVFGVAGHAVPPFWLGLILIIIFTLLLRWLPATGMLSPTGGGGPLDVLVHLVLPSISLAVVPLAVIARLTRANMLEVLGQLYVRTARAKGLPPLTVVMRHVFRNTLVGTITLLGLQAGWLLAGTVYIETVFAWPGLGSMLVNAILQRDYPLVQGGVLLVSTTYVLINLATDTLYLYLDPRLRHG